MMRYFSKQTKAFLDFLKTNITSGTVIFSPHSDDAAFSLGGILSMKILPEPVVIITIFGKTNFLGSYGLHENCSIASNIRKNEDLKFAEKIGVTLEYWDFPDAIIRFGASPDLIFINKTEKFVESYPELEERILKRFNDTNDSLLMFCPMAIGSHIDHIITNDCIVKLFSKQKKNKIIFYEDLPYINSMSKHKEAYIKDNFEKYFTPIIFRLNKHLKSKLSLIQIYETQLHDNKIDEINDYAFKLCSKYGAERVWIRNDFFE